MRDKVIYKVTNLKNGKIYIGQTSNLKERIRHYRFAAKPDSKVIVQSLILAMRKHGFENFMFDILGDYETFEELDAAEKYYIEEFDAMNPDKGYNTYSGGRAKHKGTKTTYKHSKEIIAKKSKQIVAFKNNVFKIYPSAKEYASEVGCDRSIISAAARKGKKYKKAFFYYCDDEKRKELLKTHSDKRRYCEIGKVVNEIGIEEIDGFIFLTRELVDLEDRIL